MSPARPANPLYDLTRPLRRGLGRLRARVRLLLALLGTARAAATLVLALALLFALDYSLRLPLGVRAVLLAGLVADVAWTVGRHLLRPLARPLTDALLASRVEAAFPPLHDRLASSIAFGRRIADPDNEDSPELMRAVIEETVEATRRLPFLRAARPRTAGRPAGLALGLVVTAGIAMDREPELFCTFVARDLLLGRTTWPRRTTLLVENMEPGIPLRVTRGREVTLRVRARGSVPDEVEFRYWELERGAAETERFDLNSSQEDPRLFSLSLPVQTSIAFTVAGGDDRRREVYTLQALTPPGVLGVFLDCVYPEYLGRPAERLEGGDQRLPVGTQVKLWLRLSMPVRTAALVLGHSDPVVLQPGEPTLFTHSLRIEHDLRYSIRLEGEHGETNDPAADTYFLRAVRDLAPVLRVHTPASRVQRTARGVLLMRFEAHDDYRITGTELVYQVAGGKERSLGLGGAERPGVRLAQAEPVAPERVWGLVSLDFNVLRRDDGRPVERGNAVLYRLRITDSAGQVTETPLRRVDLVPERELARTVEGRQQALFEAVERTRRKSREAGGLLTSLSDAYPGQGTPGPQALLWSRRARSAEGRIGQELRRISVKVGDLLNLYVFNRLDDASAADQMLPFYERHLLERGATGDAAFRAALYRGLWAAVEERAIRVGGSPAKLLRMSAVSHRLAGEVAPRVYRALDRFTLGPEPAAAEPLLRTALEGHKALEEGLALLGRLMREWRTYEGVVQAFKLILEIENRVERELKDLDTGESR